MWRAFGDVANHSGMERRALVVDAQPAAAVENLADDVLVGMSDLLRIAVFRRPERDHTGLEVRTGKAIRVANLVIERLEILQRRVEGGRFH